MGGIEDIELIHLSVHHKLPAQHSHVDISTNNRYIYSFVTIYMLVCRKDETKLFFCHIKNSAILTKRTTIVEKTTITVVEQRNSAFYYNILQKRQKRNWRKEFSYKAEPVFFALPL